MSTMAAVLRLLLVACAALAALAQETRSLRIGVVAQNARPMFYGVPGSGWEGENGARGPRPASMAGRFSLAQRTSLRTAGFEVAVRTQMCTAASISCTVVELASLEDRIPALQNGTVDAVLARFSVTPERRTQVTFVNPFYYAAGKQRLSPVQLDPCQTWLAPGPPGEATDLRCLETPLRAGGELFTLNSSLPNFPNGWADIAGKPVCLQSGEAAPA